MGILQLMGTTSNRMHAVSGERNLDRDATLGTALAIFSESVAFVTLLILALHNNNSSSTSIVGLATSDFPMEMGPFTRMMSPLPIIIPFIMVGGDDINTEISVNENGKHK